MTRLVNDYQFDECNGFEFKADKLIAEDREAREFDAFMSMIRGMSDEALRNLEDALNNALETLYGNDSSREVWKRAYARYDAVYNESHDRYVESVIDDFRKFSKEYHARVANGTATPEDHEFYSDWHKDIYGFRPR